MREVSNRIQRASHSGATLEVYQEASSYCVRKTVHLDIEKNYEAIVKQQNFSSLQTPTYNIIAIPVLGTEKSKSRLSISMPFVEGLGGEQVAYKGSKAVAMNLKTALDFYLINSVAQSEYSTFPSSTVRSKINSIKEKLGKNLFLFPNLRDRMAILNEYCQKDLSLPLGPCHGDLTLSNIKVTERNELVLFDFLSCEINSPLQDAAKLTQDFEYGWSFRKEKASVRVKGEIFCEHSKPNFLTTLERLFEYETRIIEALTVLRIAPYIKTQDSITIDWFNRTMDKTIRKITG